MCDADCSLREAVVAANASVGPHKIMLPPGTYTLSGAAGEDDAASGDLDLKRSVTISGAGAASTTIDGGSVDRIFDIVDSAVVKIENVTLQHGTASDSAGGGAILWDEAFSGKTLSLTLDGVILTNNHVTFTPGGDGGALNMIQDDPGSATLSILNSTISLNTLTDGDGGGIHLCCENITATITNSTISGNSAAAPMGTSSNGEGGGLYHCCQDTSVTITDSTLSGNNGPTDGGGLYTCCGVSSNTLVTLERSTVSGNMSLGMESGQGVGGGIEGEGAVTLINSTLSGNHARQLGGGIHNEDTLILTNTTIAKNTAAQGAGLSHDGSDVTLRNTLLDNIAAPGSANCFNDSAPFTSDGNNLSSDMSCALGGSMDQEGVTPLIGTLANNGGPTQTHALIDGSPAIDTGTNTGCPATDQRGQARPFDGDGNGMSTCDIGAFEFAQVPEDCDNGMDDNGNGLVDCDDFDCAGNPICPERCTNCVDDDGDGDVDREDSDCPQPLDGGMQGVGDPKGRGKAIVKCAKALKSAGGNHAVRALKGLEKCVAKLFTCAQRKPGDQACLQKAGAGCGKVLAKLDGAEPKAKAKINKACGVLSAADLGAAAGLGFDGEEPLCVDFGVPNLDDADAVGTCLLAQHICHVEQMVGLEFPRAAELLGLGGINASTALNCLFAPANGGGAGLGPRGKAAAACQQAVQKGAAKFVAGKLKIVQKCALAVLICHQQKPDKPDCVTKVRAKCQKAVAKITAPAKGLEAKLAAAIAKKCNVATLTLADVVGSTGLGFQAQAALCKALGVSSLGSIAAIAECVTRQHECRAEQLLERELPRLRELLSTAQVTLP